jgi:hypothetical protein
MRFVLPFPENFPGELFFLVFFLLLLSLYFRNHLSHLLKFFSFSLKFFLFSYLHEPHGVQALRLFLLVFHLINLFLEFFELLSVIGLIEFLTHVFPKFLVQFLELLLANGVDFVEGVLDALLVVFAEPQQVLDVLAFGSVSESDSFLYALFG